MIKQTTRSGDYVNAHSDLCEDCASRLAQYVMFMTDDDEISWQSNDERFTRIQKEATNQRANCRTYCGRAEVTA